MLNALKEVEQALASVASEDRRRAALADAVRSADAAYDLANRRYRAGAMSFLDLLDAQRSLVEARAALTASERALGSARIDLFRALGGGWQTPPPARAGA